MTRIALVIGLLLPATALATGDPSAIPWDSITKQALNLFILLAALTFLTRGAIKEGMKNRSKTIETHLEESNRMRREAQDRFDRLESRLSHMGSEVESLKEEAVAGAEREAEMIREEAAAESERITQATEKAIRDEVQSARLALQHEAAELAMNLAVEKTRTKVTDTVQDRLDTEFLGSVKKEANGHG